MTAIKVHAEWRDGALVLRGDSRTDCLRLANVASSLLIHQSHITPLTLQSATSRIVTCPPPN